VGLPWGSRRTRWRRTWPEVLCPLGGALAAAEIDSARRLTMLHGGRGKRWQAASGLLHGDGLRCAQPGGEEQAMQARRRWRGEMGNGVTPFGAGRREEGGMRCSARLQGGEMVGCARRKWAALRRNRAGSRRCSGAVHSGRSGDHRRGAHGRTGLVGSGTRAWARFVACWCCPNGDTARSARGILDPVESPRHACGQRARRSAWAVTSRSERPGRVLERIRLVSRVDPFRR
jgi:hypothetical protein